MMPVPSPQGDPKQLARPVGPGEPETPQGSERVWTHQGSGVGLFRFYAGVHPSRLGTARAGAPRGWLWGSVPPPAARIPACSLKIDRRRAGWRARCACAGAVVRQWRASRAAACSCRRSARAGSGAAPTCPGRSPSPPSSSAPRRERRSFPPRHLGCVARLIIEPLVQPCLLFVAEGI